MDIASGLLLTRLPENETHGNHLRVPSIGIVDLRLTAAGNSSLFHLPKDAPSPQGVRTGADSFNFLPEHDVCDLIIDIDNQFDIVDRAKLELFKRYKKDPLWTLDLVKLGPTWVRHGKHTVKWDGRIIKSDTALPGTINAEETAHDLTGQTVVTDATDGAPFPDGWVTLEHPPYKLRLTLESDLLPDNPAVAWTYFHVLLEKIELKLGPEEAIPNDGTAPTLDQDKAVRKDLETAGGLPAVGATSKIYLLSNRFKNSDAEFDAAANVDFSTYKTMWGDGPRIPILAKLWMRAADGTSVDLETAAKGAVALGRAKFLWDVADPDEVALAVDAEAVTFLNNTRNYYKNATDSTRAAKDHTYYEGDNCHVDRGGRRGPDGVTVFPDQAGYAPNDVLTAATFPFAVGTTVKVTNKRKWAAYSHGWIKGKLKGHTGVLFRPSRMAGDNYIVSVQLAYDWGSDGNFTIDITDKDLKVPAKITAKTGTFEIWRRLHVSRYIRKPGVADFMANFASVADYYKQAFIELKDNVAAGDKYFLNVHKGAPGDGAPLDFNALCRTKLSALGYDLYNNHVVASATEDHSTVAAVFRVVPYATFVQNLHRLKFNHPATDFTEEAAVAGVSVKVFAEGLGTTANPLPEPAGADAPTTAKRRRARRLNETRAYLIGQGYKNLLNFAWTVEGFLDPASDAVATDIKAISGCGPSGAAAPPGFTVLHYEFIHSGTQEWVDAGNADYVRVKGTALDAADRKPDKVLFLLTRPFAATFAHECGHHLFLPHPKPPSSDNAALKVHDKDDTKCLMSYDANRHGFCGFCQSRLRGWGWSGFKLDADSTNNKKP